MSGRVTVRGLLSATIERLAAAGCVSAEAEARWLVEEALGVRSGGLAAQRGDAVDEPGQARLRAMVARRVAGEPLQHVIGWAPFGALRLAVGPGVFVPRPETEGLAERAAARLPTTAGAVAVDLCTGSGAIACFLKAARPVARVVATELDPVALGYARRNAEPLGVEVLAGDLDEPLPGTLAGRVDVLTANVPYVPTDQITLLPSDVRDHEPRAALDGGRDGLDVLRRVTAVAGRWLGPGGWILCEVGDDQARSAADLLAGAGFAGVAVLPDLAGRERVVEGQWTHPESR
jgi:release factor glutamine methyltransferase